MSYSPGSGIAAPIYGTWSPRWTPAAGFGNADPSSATWESANRAVYYPIVVPPCVVRRVWWANGATTTGAATVEVGVYRDASYLPAAKIISGSATQGTASEVQFVDVTDTPLAAGRYWIAITMSSATNTTGFRTTGWQANVATVRFAEASANPLPATATPASSVTQNIWLCGFATTASP